jgi:DNA mismatch endonuclease, patch repair protein
MVDCLTKEQRSYCMSQIKSKNTKAELLLRKTLWLNGIRNYRIKNNIYGNPDLVFTTSKLVVFIDGCFWHKCPYHFIRPKTRSDFWDIKISQNVKRDKKVIKKLRDDGWIVMRFWEHSIKKDVVKCILKIRNRLKVH